MKHKAKLLATMAVLAVVLLLVSKIDPHIPANAGGNVDIETDMGRTSFNGFRVFQKLSDELTKQPAARKFRIHSTWSDCGVGGKRVIVYDRSTGVLMNWVEGKHFRQWRGSLVSSSYSGVSEKLIHQISATEPSKWHAQYSKSKGFDFLQKHGCTKLIERRIEPLWLHW